MVLRRYGIYPTMRFGVPLAFNVQTNQLCIRECRRWISAVHWQSVNGADAENNRDCKAKNIPTRTQECYYQTLGLFVYNGS